MSTINQDPAALVERAKGGDIRAIVELIHQYETRLRSMLRIHQRTRQECAMDSDDVYQSVMADFLGRYQRGEYYFESSQQLFRLFVQLMIHKLVDHVRRESTLKRGHGRSVDNNELFSSLPAADETPSHIVSARELFDAVMADLTPEERAVAILRFEGEEWTAIAERFGESLDTPRKRLTRGLERVVESMRLLESDETPPA